MAGSGDAGHRSTTLMLLGIGLGLAGLELATNFVEPYGLFHDELYYWAGAQRLQLGYVDHPPLAPWILALCTAVLGDGALGFAAVPALCALGTVVLSGWMARSLGAGRFGQLLAGLAVAVAPTYLVFFSFYSVNAIELLLWAAASLAVVELIRTGDERLWLTFGLLGGIALLNKHTFLLFAFGVAVGVVATPLRSQLRRSWPWLGAAVALALASPNVYWNLVNDWPSLRFYSARGEGILDATLSDALLLQVASMNPLNLLIWAPGVWFLLFSRTGRPYRPLGVAFVVLFVVVLMAGQRRVDRMAGVYPVVLAAGAVAWDRWRPRWRRALRGSLVALLLAAGALVVPATLPLLPPQGTADYFEAIGQKPEIEVGDVGSSIPLWVSGRLEWERLAREAIAAWESLPPEEQARAAFLTPHWVFASVLEYYSRDRPAPPVVSPHNAYWFWRAEAEGRDVVISIGISPQVLSDSFRETRRLAVFRCRYCAPFRPDLSIDVSYGPERPLEELLLEWRHFGIMPAEKLRKGWDEP